MNEKEVTIKSLLIEANELIKPVFAGKSELSQRELAKRVGEKPWLAADMVGIEPD